MRHDATAISMYIYRKIYGFMEISSFLRKYLAKLLDSSLKILTFAAFINQSYMSKFCVYIPLEPFVKQWLVNKYGEPVKFQSQSIENYTIQTFVIKKPANVEPDVADDRSVAVVIPDSIHKPAEYFNHLTPRGKEAVKQNIEYLFNQNLWTELGDMSSLGCKTMTAIYAWCEKHGISIDYSDTIRQRWYRIRNSYTKKGIDLMKKKRSRK